MNGQWRRELKKQMLNNLQKEHYDLLDEKFNISKDELEKMVKEEDEEIDELILKLLEAAPENPVAKEIFDEISDCYK